jgi:hypothetical protein
MKNPIEKMVLRSEINENFDMDYVYINVNDQTKATTT